MGEFSAWPALKPSTKWGQMPMLECPDGKVLTQTLPMFYWLAKKVSVNGTPVMPADDDLLFDVMEMIGAFEDCRMKLVPTFSIKDQAEKEAARAALVAEDGAITQILQKIEATAGDNYMVGGVLTAADLWAFFKLNFMRCGFLDGLPTDFLQAYPKLSAIVATVTELPELKAYYTKMAESDQRYKSFAGLWEANSAMPDFVIDDT